MENAVKKLIDQAAHWDGYLEKKSNAQLDDFTANAAAAISLALPGTIRHTPVRTCRPSLGAPCSYQRYLCRYLVWRRLRNFWAAACTIIAPQGSTQFKKAGRWAAVPEPGAVIFFTNGQRAYHTGIVTEVTATRIKTIEGNTSGASGVIENGGGVCRKAYSRSYGKILGYGLPDWSIVSQSEYVLGWHHDSNGWWYADTPHTYYKSCWQVINHHKYYFNQDGYALTDWHQIDGKWYYFEPAAGHPLECALYVTDASGVQGPGEF